MSMSEYKSQLIELRAERDACQSEFQTMRAERDAQSKRLLTIKNSIINLESQKLKALDQSALTTACQQISEAQEQKLMCETLINNLTAHINKRLPTQISRLEDQIKSVEKTILLSHRKDIIAHFQQMSDNDILLLKDFVAISNKLKDMGLNHPGYDLGAAISEAQGSLIGSEFENHFIELQLRIVQ